MSEIRMAVLQLHATFLFRFRDDPAALRAWATATDMRIGPRKPASEPAPVAAPNPPPELGQVA